MSEFDYRQLDEIIHSRPRLAVMAVLATLERADFTFLRKQISASDGSLSMHLRKLEEAGYITVDKQFVRRKPVTSYALTPLGHEALARYVDRMESLLAHLGAPQKDRS